MFFRLPIEEIATRAALERTESRGTHFREDYPARRDDRWLVNIVFRRDPVTGELHSQNRPVEQTVVRLSELPEYAGQTSPWH
jgi:succinate dehydrogenase/fumarate reductase flavoprotein subunit